MIVDRPVNTQRFGGKEGWVDDFFQAHFGLYANSGGGGWEVLHRSRIPTSRWKDLKRFGGGDANTVRSSSGGSNERLLIFLWAIYAHRHGMTNSCRKQALVTVIEAARPFSDCCDTVVVRNLADSQ